MANQFKVSVSTIVKWQSSKVWKEISDSFACASEIIKDTNDSVFKEDHLDRLEKWQSLQERFATTQMTLAVKLAGYTIEILDQIKKTEELSLETLKQIGNFSGLSMATCRLRESASEAMNTVLAIDTIFESVGTEPKQLELDFGDS